MIINAFPLLPPRDRYFKINYLLMIFTHWLAKKKKKIRLGHWKMIAFIIIYYYFLFFESKKRTSIDGLGKIYFLMAKKKILIMLEIKNWKMRFLESKKKKMIQFDELHFTWRFFLYYSWRERGGMNEKYLFENFLRVLYGLPLSRVII